MDSLIKTLSLCFRGMILTGDLSQIVYPRQECPYSSRGCNNAMNWELFYSYVCMLLSSWHVFRAIYEHNIISFSRFSEKADTMAREIVTFFQSCGSDACESEVAGFLIQVLAEDFNTDVEDDSDFAVARWLIDGYAYSIHGDWSLLQELQTANLPLLPGFNGQVIPPAPRTGKQLRHNVQNCEAVGAMASVEFALQPGLDDPGNFTADEEYFDSCGYDDDVDDGAYDASPYDDYL